MYYTAKEIAKEIGVSDEAIKYLCRQGIIPHRRIGRTYLFSKNQRMYVKKYYQPRKKLMELRKKNSI